MKIRKRILTFLCIILTFIMLLFAYGYINSLVSYKYEVQDSLTSGPDREKNLGVHQKEIMDRIDESKIGSISVVILLVITLTVRVAKPSLRGKLQYV